MINITYDARYTVDLDELTDFQQDMKTITQDALDTLKESIKASGFFVPIFAWRKTPSSKTYIIDGHQRVRALLQFRDEGEVIPPIPVEYISAKSKKDAAEKLLKVTSQFGDINIENLEMWAGLFNLDLPQLDIRLVNHEIDLAELTLDLDTFFEYVEEENLPDEGKILICPHCGGEIKV